MTFIFLILAALCASCGNCAMRKTIDFGGTTKGYLTFYYFVSCCAGFFLNSLHTLEFSFNPQMAALGAFTGILVVIMMLCMGAALRRGPSGLTFAFQNSGAIFPPLFLAFIFGHAFGFTLSLGEMIGMGLVIGGLFWSSRGSSDKKMSRRWIVLAIMTFIFQAFILTIFQWRCLLISSSSSHLLIPFHCTDIDEKWFMPAMFFSAWIIQLVLFLYVEKRVPRTAEVLGGSIGGVANGLATICLLHATKLATSHEKSMLFPLFAVFVIFICNLYGRKFYRETVNWFANGCCMAGILIGTVW